MRQQTLSSYSLIYIQFPHNSSKCDFWASPRRPPLRPTHKHHRSLSAILPPRHPQTERQFRQLASFPGHNSHKNSPRRVAKMHARWVQRYHNAGLRTPPDWTRREGPCAQQRSTESPFMSEKTQRASNPSREKKKKKKRASKSRKSHLLCNEAAFNQKPPGKERACNQLHTYQQREFTVNGRLDRPSRWYPGSI